MNIATEEEAPSLLRMLDLPFAIVSRLDIRPNGCMVWTGCTDRKGYGQMWYRGRYYRVHALAHELLYGPIVKGMVRDHLCREEGCVNVVEHIEVVTNGENIRRGYAARTVIPRKVTCPKGHLYSGSNLYIRVVNGRERFGCKECRKEVVKKHYYKSVGAV